MKVILSKLNWILDRVNRQKIVLFIGALVLILSARSSWYKLPSDTLEVFQISLAWANIYRFLPILFAILGIFFSIWQGSKQAIRLLFWGGLFIVLLFPYFQSTWTPSVAFLAKNYYSQGAKADRHVERNFSEIQAQWKQNIELDKPDLPESTVNFLIENSSLFQASSLERFFTDILAYNPSFFGFINPNWAIAILGFFISLFGFYLEQTDRAVQALVRDMRKLLPYLATGLFLLGLSVLVPNIIHYQLNIAYARGEYQFVQNVSKTLSTLYPPFQGDEHFLERLAKASYYNDQPEPYLIEFGKGLESYRQSNWLNAETHFQNSLTLQPKSFLVRGYLATVILARGVNNFNAPKRHKAETSTDFFERTLQIFPNHTEALYDLMLARAINGEFDKSANKALKIIQSQKIAQRPRSALLGQAYLHLSWKDFKDDNLEKAWQRYRQSVDDGAWKDVIEAES